MRGPRPITENAYRLLTVTQVRPGARGPPAGSLSSPTERLGGTAKGAQLSKLTLCEDQPAAHEGKQLWRGAEGTIRHAQEQLA
jgi:hypothetical protein